ncbi:hypothetical protein SAMN05421676_10543 [Salinibacillus kushneri]|uniref:Uncharacterized protein n=1 Tax=Salinibacillus kushneri TaxID=237682 RepID=A0A1I0EQ91_9BACI|nr:hypothetical protein [Salinibacillus kushneri]SET47701.1 hypothetical protein SAMN05421676_10543 [Salinibacillus kushneri]
MTSSERKWALVILVIVLSAYILPYTILTNEATWYGSFLLWTVLTLIIIGVNYFITRDWSK